MRSHWPNQVGLRGQDAELIPVRRELLPFLDHVATLAIERAPYLHDVEAQNTYTSGMALATFVVQETIVGQPIGIIRLADADLRNRVASVQLEIASSNGNATTIGEAVLLLLRFAFANWELRKVYAYTSRFPIACLPSWSSRYFEREATLRQQYLYDGTALDDEIYAFYRSSLDELVSALPQASECRALPWGERAEGGRCGE